MINLGVLDQCVEEFRVEVGAPEGSMYLESLNDFAGYGLRVGRPGEWRAEIALRFSYDAAIKYVNEPSTFMTLLRSVEPPFKKIDFEASEEVVRYYLYEIAKLVLSPVVLERAYHLRDIVDAVSALKRRAEFIEQAAATAKAQS